MLDAVYRPSLAWLISELSKGTQFIASHGCDILDYGDQFYRVQLHPNPECTLPCTFVHATYSIYIPIYITTLSLLLTALKL
jgi:hypothetical protein